MGVAVLAIVSQVLGAWGSPLFATLSSHLQIPVRVRRQVSINDSTIYRAFAHQERMTSLRFLFSGIASEQGLARTLDNREDLRPVRFIPCQDDPDTCSCAPRILGWWGRAGVPSVDTPSLNPGLWHNLYPPIASRRQGKKNENGCDGEPRRALRAREEPCLPAPCPYVRGFF